MELTALQKLLIICVPRQYHVPGEDPRGRPLLRLPVPGTAMPLCHARLHFGAVLTCEWAGQTAFLQVTSARGELPCRHCPPPRSTSMALGAFAPNHINRTK